MKETLKRMRHKLLIGPLMILLVLIVNVSVRGQNEQTQPPAQTPSADTRDPIRQLNLTPEQREQIRLIREQNREERAQVTRGVRETNRALEEVLNSDNPDQALIEQRLREASTAQAAAMRMRILNEVKIRRVLTQEQRTLLRTLRRQGYEVREGRRLENMEERQMRRAQRSLRLREKGSSTPVMPGAKRRQPIP